LIKHNPKRVAVAVLVAGVALAAVAIKQSAADDVRAVPVLEEIPSILEASPADGEVLRAYSVSGMCCESCTRKLHDKVLGMEGVEACAVDLTEERVTLITKGGVASEEILSTLNFDKYSAVELNAGS
jgi:copper chaperone CopZ